MIQISIKFDKGLTHLVNSLTRLIKTADKQVATFPKICAIEYVQFIRKKIIQQSFLFTSLSDDYAEWKNKYFPNAKTFWHLSGELLNAIQVINMGGNSWAGTIPSSAIDSGGKNWGRSGGEKSILYYALLLEEGNVASNLPPRPLFGLANKEYFTTKFQDKIEKLRTLLIKQWR
jgi:hypothetical protein